MNQYKNEGKIDDGLMNLFPKLIFLIFSVL
jgi:hypothetical protein